MSRFVVPILIIFLFTRYSNSQSLAKNGGLLNVTDFSVNNKINLRFTEIFSNPIYYSINCSYDHVMDSSLFNLEKRGISFSFFNSKGYLDSTRGSINPSFLNFGIRFDKLKRKRNYYGYSFRGGYFHSIEKNNPQLKIQSKNFVNFDLTLLYIFKKIGLNADIGVNSLTKVQIKKEKGAQDFFLSNMRENEIYKYYFDEYFQIGIYYLLEVDDNNNLKLGLNIKSENFDFLYDKYLDAYVNFIPYCNFQSKSFNFFYSFHNGGFASDFFIRPIEQNIIFSFLLKNKVDLHFNLRQQNDLITKWRYYETSFGVSYKF